MARLLRSWPLGITHKFLVSLIILDERLEIVLELNQIEHWNPEMICFLLLVKSLYCNLRITRNWQITKHLKRKKEKKQTERKQQGKVAKVAWTMFLQVPNLLFPINADLPKTLAPYKTGMSNSFPINIVYTNPRPINATLLVKIRNDNERD